MKAWNHRSRVFQQPHYQATLASVLGADDCMTPVNRSEPASCANFCFQPATWVPATIRHRVLNEAACQLSLMIPHYSGPGNPDNKAGGNSAGGKRPAITFTPNHRPPPVRVGSSVEGRMCVRDYWAPKELLSGMPRFSPWPKTTSDPPIWRGGQNPAVPENPCTYVETSPGLGRSPCHVAVVAGPLREGGIRSRR